MAAFTVYFDASGSDHDQPCLAVAGFVTDANQWVEFERLWLERLKVDGLSYFHAKEISRVLPERSKRDSLYIDLINIISGSGLRQFGCCIVNSALAAVITKQDRKDWYLTSYTIAARACAGQVRQWFQSWNASSLPEFIFECGDQGKGALTALLEKDDFPRPIFKPKKDRVRNGFVERAAVPLQAADLLAFEFFDLVRKVENDGHLLRIRPSYDALYKIPGEARLIRLKGMRDLHKFGTMDPDTIWFPDGPDDIPVPGLS